MTHLHHHRTSILLTTLALAATGTVPAAAATPTAIPTPAMLNVCAVSLNDAIKSGYRFDVNPGAQTKRDGAEVLGDVDTGENGKSACVAKLIPLPSGLHTLMFINDFDSVSFEQDWTPKGPMRSHLVKVTTSAGPTGTPATTTFAPKQQVPVPSTQFVMFENHTTTITLYVTRTKPYEPLKTKPHKKKH